MECNGDNKMMIKVIKVFPLTEKSSYFNFEKNSYLRRHTESISNRFFNLMALRTLIIYLFQNFDGTYLNSLV
jgi:hypothetical protein